MPRVQDRAPGFNMQPVTRLNVRSVFLALLVVLIPPLQGCGESRLDRAPHIQVLTLTAGERPLIRPAAAVTLVNFWSTSCTVCLEEIPHLRELHEAHAHAGLDIIGIAMPYDRPDHVIAARDRHAIPYTLVLDLQGDAMRGFGTIERTPTTFLIADDGRVLDRTEGRIDRPRLTRLILRAIAQQPE